MRFWRRREHQPSPGPDMEAILDTTCRFFNYEDPCDAAWFRWAVRPVVERIIYEHETS